MRLAAIDIGSNSIKLVVVEAWSSRSFTVLAQEKEVVRLGQRTLREHRLSLEAIERAAQTINRFRSIAESIGVEQLIVVATASVREAVNSSEFIEEVLGITGVKVRILSGIEEARLIGIAASQGCAPVGSELLNIDIGGGSTEISLMRRGVPAGLFSVKLGAIGLTERFIANDPPKADELRSLREEVRAALERLSLELKGARWQYATGTSGTILAIGDAIKLNTASSSFVTGFERLATTEITLVGLEKLNEGLSRMTVADRRRMRGISSQRSEIIIAGGHILEGTMRSLAIDLLRTCDYSLREGVIINRLRAMDSHSPAKT